MMNDQEKFMKYIGDNYDDVVKKMKILCSQRKQVFDQDIFHECLLRCHKAIEKKGYLQDTSAYGIESYMLRSYFNLVLELKRSAHNAKRDWNYDSDNIGELHERWTNENQTSANVKIASDLFKDFSILYMMMIVEQNFDNEHFYLFRVKELTPGMTYKKLSEETGMKGVRAKVVEVKNYLKENVSKEDIKDAFNKVYGELI